MVTTVDGVDDGLAEVMVVEAATFNKGMAETMVKFTGAIETVMMAEGDANKTMMRTTKIARATGERRKIVY